MHTYTSRDEAITAAAMKLGKRAKAGRHYSLQNYGRRAFWFEYAQVGDRYFADDDAAYAFAEKAADDTKHPIHVRYSDGTKVTLEPIADHDIDDDDIEEQTLPTQRRVTFAPLLERCGKRGRKPDPNNARKIALIAERAATTGITSTDMRDEFGYHPSANLRSIFTGSKRGVCDRHGLDFVSRREKHNGRSVMTYYIGDAAKRVAASEATQLAFGF